MSASISHLAPFRSLISQRFGLVMPERFDRLLPRALDRAMEIAGARDAETLCLHLETQPWTSPAWQAVIDTVTVRETSFFRQSGWWDALAEAALKPLIEARRRDGTRHLRCLSLGCASGDEPYSLAMILHRLLLGEPGWTVEIVGADLCQAALNQAQAGIFDARAVQEVEPRERELWFRPTGRQRFALSEGLRSRVAFRLFNLAEAAEAARSGAQPAAPGAPADLVICRNVIIHMEPSRQPGIARYLTAQLRPGGILAVSPVEATAAWFAPLLFEATGQAILFTRPDGRPPAPARKPRPVPQAAEPSPAPLPATPKAVSPPDSSARLARVRHLADLGLFEEARRLCEQMLGSHTEAELLMALVCQALGDIASAEAAARRGLAAAPQSPAAHYVHAIICLRTGITAQARRSLRRAVELLDTGEEGKRLGTHLSIRADEIRQAARRLGVGSAGPAGTGGAHDRPH